MKRIIILIIIILCLLNFSFLMELRKHNNRANQFQKFILDKITIYLPRDYVLPVLSQEPIKLEELYAVDGYIDSTKAYFEYVFGIEETNISQYLYNTRNGIKKLIKLIENDGDTTEIENLKNELIEIQRDTLDRHSKREYNWYKAIR